MIFQEQASLREKLAILADAAKYDVACTSSGVDRRSRPGQLGNTAACGICHTFASDGRCISLLKILFTNECIHDCKYCLNRCSNDIPGPPLHRRRSAPLRWSSTGATILKDCF